MGYEKEHVQSLQGQRLNSEEVSRPDMGRVVLEKGSSGLRGRATAYSATVAPDSLSTDVIAQLAEFAHDAQAAPAGILAGQSSDELTDLHRDA